MGNIPLRAPTSWLTEMHRPLPYLVEPVFGAVAAPFVLGTGAKIPGIAGGRRDR